MSGDTCRPNHNPRNVLKQKAFREREIFLRPKPAAFSIRRLSRLPDSNKLREEQSLELPQELLAGKKQEKRSRKLYLPAAILSLILLLFAYVLSREPSRQESAQTQMIESPTTEASTVKERLELNFTEFKRAETNASEKLAINNTSVKKSESTNVFAFNVPASSQNIDKLEPEVVDGAYLIYPALSEAELEHLREKFRRDLNERADLVGVVLRETSVEVWDLILVFPADEHAELEFQELATGIVQAVICGSRLYYLDKEARLRVYDSMEEDDELEVKILANSVRTFSLEKEENKVYLYIVDEGGKFRKIEQ
ncbi:MAG: hypothetical protein Q4P65_03665 [Eubacteriales bacterium]|nr:hypothetical protein [Eubacteriales bacterium]